MSQLSRWARNRSGNVAMMFALAAPIMMFGVGFAIDYGLYARAHVKLEMLADEATLSMTSAAGMQKSDKDAAAFAQSLFCSQAVQIPNIALQNETACENAVQPLCDNKACTSTVVPPTSPRNVTLTYNLSYAPMFATLLQVSSLPESGKSAASSSSGTALNTNFYVLLDNQGSMALPDSTTGIQNMIKATKMQNGGKGCAFACHEAAPEQADPANWPQDTLGNTCSDGNPPTATDNASGTPNSVCAAPLKQHDNYWVAGQNNIKLRFDDVKSAIGNLLPYAQSEQTNSLNTPTYQFQVWSVNQPTQPGLDLIMPLTPNYTSNWSSVSNNLQLYLVYTDGEACADVACDAGAMTATWSSTSSAPGGYVNWQDVGDFTSPMGAKMQAIQSAIQQTPIGDGASGDAAKATLIIVTDGIEDTIAGGSLSVTPWDSTALGVCSQLKSNPNVKIAILYTTYYQQPSGFWLYDDYVAPLLQNGTDQIGATLSKCATPGLFFTAGLDDNLQTDLFKLFDTVNQNSRLTQ